MHVVGPSQPSSNPLLLCLLPPSPSLSHAQQTSKDLDVMRSEHARLETLGKLFGCSELLAGATGVIKTTSDELAALAAVWQCAGSAQRKLDEWNKTVGGTG